MNEAVARTLLAKVIGKLTPEAILNVPDVADALMYAFADEVEAEYKLMQREYERQDLVYLIGYAKHDTGLDSYLGFGAEYEGAAIATSRNGDIRIIAVPAQHANWQSLRLQSGLRGGGSTFNTFEAAVTEANLIASCM